MKKRQGPLPPILGKGHAHPVDREPHWKVDVELGLIEYEETLMPKTLDVGGDVEVMLPFSDPDKDEWVPATIIDLLASQFTADVEGKTHFFLYTDKGVTWRQLQEQ